jgi:hypothetical protein
MPKGALKVVSGLSVVVRALSTGGFTTGNRQTANSDVIHDHIRLCHYQIRAIAHIGVRIGARYVQHLGLTEGGETVGCPSGSRQLTPSGRSTEMISNCRSDANRQVLVERICEQSVWPSSTVVYALPSIVKAIAR